MSIRPSQPPRTDRKEATRQRILAAALQLVEEGRAPSELGLREVARAAGMAAPSIYNHFADMDELGLALIDHCLMRLRGLVRSARKELDAVPFDQALDQLLERFIQYLNEYESILRLLILQWFNHNTEYRKTIRREMSIMRQDLAATMQSTAQRWNLKQRAFAAESDAVFSLLITYILNVIDTSAAERRERLQLLKKQLQMVMIGSQFVE